MVVGDGGCVEVSGVSGSCVFKFCCSKSVSPCDEMSNDGGDKVDVGDVSVTLSSNVCKLVGGVWGEVAEC